MGHSWRECSSSGGALASTGPKFKTQYTYLQQNAKAKLSWLLTHGKYCAAGYERCKDRLGVWPKWQMIDEALSSISSIGEKKKKMQR
jgi:hypothetical protein